MYTKQWWPPLWLSMGLGWCAPLLSGNCCSSLSNTSENAKNSIVCRHWEGCNLRVTWPAGSHRRCPVEHASRHTRNESRYPLLSLQVRACVKEEVKCVALTMRWPHLSCWSQSVISESTTKDTITVIQSAPGGKDAWKQSLSSGSTFFHLQQKISGGVQSSCGLPLTCMRSIKICTHCFGTTLYMSIGVTYRISNMIHLSWYTVVEKKFLDASCICDI